MNVLGLTVGTVVEGRTLDERRAAYGCDICYCSNKELVFDYLKDRVTLGEVGNPIPLQLERVYRDDSRLGSLLLRGLHFAIVDEADSVLVDEARVPVIISRSAPAGDNDAYYLAAIDLARSLADDDFVVLLRSASSVSYQRRSLPSD